VTSAVEVLLVSTSATSMATTTLMIVAIVVVRSSFHLSEIECAILFIV
jgi:hypothetical protein